MPGGGGPDDRREEDALLRLAYVDALTGLANANMAANVVAELARPGEPRALVVVGLDRFGAINDMLGYAGGDLALARLARRLGEAVAPGNLVARLGGDLFLLVLAEARDAAGVEARVGAAMRRLGDPLLVDGREFMVSATAGGVLDPGGEGRFADLLAAADRALRRAKRTRRGGLCLHEEGGSAAEAGRAAREQQVRGVLRDRRIRAAFQAKVDIHTGDVVGVEALLRWEDEGGAIQTPGALLPIAAELGLMDEVTDQMLDEVLAGIDAVNAAFGPAVSISVNIAAGQAARPAFMREVADRIAARAHAPRFLLEVTEDAVLDKAVFRDAVMPLLRERGLRVSVDDFGTGYSSLATLADLAADELKVDRAFVTDIHNRPRSQIVLRAVEALGVALGMSVIVEGVETAEELAYLRNSTTIRYAQGFLFAPPMLLGCETTRRNVDRRSMPARAGAPARERVGNAR